MEKQGFTANADYEENNTQAIRLEAGQEVTSGPADKTWPIHRVEMAMSLLNFLNLSVKIVGQR
jgi:hypothetical protein